MSETNTTKNRRDLFVVGLALFCSLVLAGVIGGGVFFWQELEQSKADNAALRAQVIGLGGKPVAEGKPGDRGPTGSPGPPGPPGSQGLQGKQGPIGITGRSPECLLVPTRCVGPKGATGQQGPAGPEGSQGDPGATGKTGDQGPAGPQGEVGPDGKQGLQGDAGPEGKPGPQGRGITDTDCVGTGGDSHWVITYTDGSSSTASGPCRLVIVDPPSAK